ncbi:hypothetical protein GIB67_014436 [Kingdonia uniflora]|uniref:Uncharacterized protein n=1 Tax=Kingdonia uniflora TaxID=39325 RepID=A0A7J7LYY1_9MAGN|nr:hypothetical protein GIB67_014436 [Kingdonia uniflora]
MGPNKNQKQQTQKKPSSGPKLQISAENEQRLRRLLLNNNNKAQAQASPNVETISKPQKAKKLRTIYDKLSCEGFTSDQIELALSSLNDGADTLEAALDWLCFNLPGNELPLKFASATSTIGEGGSISIISTAREDWAPSATASKENEEQEHSVSVKIKERKDDATLDLRQPSQADWIRRYMEQQDEDEWETLANDVSGKDPMVEDSDPCSRAISIAKEYHIARLEAADAKVRKDKKSQEQAGNKIRKLKQEMSDIGLSDDILATGLEDEGASQDVMSDSMPIPSVDFTGMKIESLNEESLIENFSFEVFDNVDDLSTKTLTESNTVETEEPDVELSGLFSEDASASVPLPPELSKMQKKEKRAQYSGGNVKKKMAGILKKGDSRKIPKAVLHQLCQSLGWEAPKFNRVPGTEDRFNYIISILRTSSGRGKSRKAGGLITLQLPDQDQSFESAEDAQNMVAAFTLSHLFPELHIDLLVTEPYSSFVIKWREEESLTKVEDNVETRRASFVDSLLSAESLRSSNPVKTPHEKLAILQVCENVDSRVTAARAKRVNDYKEVESTTLRQEQENKMKKEKYKKMLESRAALPIAVLKDDILQLLKENDVLVVCGETGCGKTTQAYSAMRHEEGLEAERNEHRLGEPQADTVNNSTKAPIRPHIQISNRILHRFQGLSGVKSDIPIGVEAYTVPQFILDDMIEAGQGGYSNIVCTQPRRIAAISVAERVADERCESAPGSDHSLVGFQVRLESARNDKTKLLFCTTGILLRKLAGDTNLDEVTHVIVDEVHERSLLGDFLLIVLKNLIEKQSSQSTRKLKVILMSATVDSDLFSRYFGNCPVLTAQGRTHPVSTYFLEDIYDNLKYCLASDSPASIRCMAPTKEKVPESTKYNHRGKTNLVLSSWGDDYLLSENYINPNYDPSTYEAYSDRTRENLKSINEDAIDFDLLEDLLYHVDDTYTAGAILVFLPGVAEIYLLLDKLAASYRFGGVSSDWLLPLHSSLASGDQRKVFLTPPENIRKVIVATDIAETSITIDDVIYVVDCGKHKENRYNPQKKLSSMVEDWISRANAKQRRGRAGRVKPGICFCLYTRYRYESLMRPFQMVTRLRALVWILLTFTFWYEGTGDAADAFGRIVPTNQAIEPPREEAMMSAIAILYEVGAIEGDEELTPLGYHLAKLPVDVLIGKMLIYGGIFCCLSPILSVSAFLSYKSPFIYPKDERQKVEKAKLSLLSDKLEGVKDSNDDDRQSDHLVMVVAYNKWAKVLHESILCAGLYPNVAATEDGIVGVASVNNLKSSVSPLTKGRSFWYDGRREVYIHPSSINNNLKAYQYPFLVYLEKVCNLVLYLSSVAKITPYSSAIGELHHREYHICNCCTYHFVKLQSMVETNKIFLRDTSVISPYSILLFGGSINIQHQTELVVIDGWLKLAAPAQTAVLFKELRLTLHSVLKELIRKPEMATMANNEVIRSIVHLLLEEDKSQK